MSVFSFSGTNNNKCRSQVMTGFYLDLSVASHAVVSSMRFAIYPVLCSKHSKQVLCSKHFYKLSMSEVAVQPVTPLEALQGGNSPLNDFVVSVAEKWGNVFSGLEKVHEPCFSQ